MTKLDTFPKNSFFADEVDLKEVFTVEDFTDEHKMIAQTTKDFVEQDVMPVLPKIENQEFEESKKLIKQSGDLGLLGPDIPEEFGGLGLDKVSSIVITEQMAKTRSFVVTYSGQVGIGSLPIVYYGTDEQKAAYLPSVAAGEKIGSYALTEPDAGTDALGIKTTAKLSEDGTHYILNGEKQFITNASFADFFILYAKIDGEKFTAFIIDRDTEGLSIGPEEQKMGLKGSSTTPVILNDVKVPVENVLGEIGRGHSIAFNILNIGRHKISATCLGTAKRALELAVAHATERKQFKRPLAEFSLIKEKIADMVLKIFAMECMVYRTAGEFEKGARYCEENNLPFLKILKNYAVECSANKVYASEALDAVVDEALQIHGGYGYVNEYEIETLYRDSRINRIFEGTNEINRMVIANTLLSEDGFPAVKKMKGELTGRFERQWNFAERLRELTNTLVRDVKANFTSPDEEQELLAAIADLATASFALESALIRTEKIFARKAGKKAEQYERIVKVLAEVIATDVLQKGLTVAGNMSAEFKQQLTEVFQQQNNSEINLVEEKRKIADTVISSGY